MLFRRPHAGNGRKHKLAGFLGAVLASVVAISVASYCGDTIGKTLCFGEVWAAVDAGLREDCLNLLLNWPVKDDRIGDWGPEYSNLPASIKMLAPAYVLNASMDDTSLPPNIGICKNGFGGFAWGIRVFRSDQDAARFVAVLQRTLEIGRDFRCERTTPGIYFWWMGT